MHRTPQILRQSKRMSIKISLRNIIKQALALR